MFISRYALACVCVAVLSMFGLTQADPSGTRPAITPGTTTAFSAPNSVHVQVMREATSAYPAKPSIDAGTRDNERASCRQNTEPYRKRCAGRQSTDTAGQRQ